MARLVQKYWSHYGLRGYFEADYERLAGLGGGKNRRRDYV